MVQASRTINDLQAKSFVDAASRLEADFAAEEGSAALAHALRDLFDCFHSTRSMRGLRRPFNIPLRLDLSSDAEQALRELNRCDAEGLLATLSPTFRSGNPSYSAMLQHIVEMPAFKTFVSSYWDREECAASSHVDAIEAAGRPERSC